MNKITYERNKCNHVFMASLEINQTKYAIVNMDFSDVFG